MLSPGPVYWGWRALLRLSVVTFIPSGIYILEPRPSHWWSTLSAIEHWLWTRSCAEYALRIRRWWRWRKKYAMRTKLNV